MKVILLLAVLFVLYKNAECFACSKDFCKTADCNENLVCDDKTEVLVPKGGTCGCCDACYRLLNEGERCVPRFHGGGQFLAKCKEGLECGKDQVCVKKA